MEKKNLIIILVVGLIIIIGAIIVLINVSKNKTNSETNQKENVNDNSIFNNINNSTQEKTIEETDTNKYSTGKHNAIIEIQNYGTIELELDADVAPITVANFAKLANQGFYNGLTFHRIIDGFMIQGGDPKGDGTGGSSENIKGEFSANGVNNSISHVRGVISMARSNDFNSASSQFFIVHEDSKFLDGQYAGFGKVTNGIEIVDKICKDIKSEDNNGTVSKQNQPIISKITMIN